MITHHIKSGCVCLLIAVGINTTVLASEVIPVKTRLLAAVAIYPQLKAPASVISTNSSRISAEVTARIFSLPAAVGEKAEKDQVIVQLEQNDYQLAMEQEQAKLDALLARLKFANYELKRAQSLSKQQAVSEQLLKQREAELNTLQAEVDGQRIAVKQAKRRLDKTLIRAPFPAVISEHIGQIGELAAPGTPLAHIIDHTSLEVSAKIQARHAKEIRQAKSLTLFSDGKTYPLRLRAITPVIDSKTRTREVRLNFRNQTALPGSAGELLWEHSSASLPADLLVKRQGTLGIFILNNNRAQFIELPDAEEGRPALTRLSLDTPVITQGRFRLQDGDPVSVQSEKK